MRISYILNSSLPSNNASSLQVIKTSEALVKLVDKVFLITPDTGLNKSIKNFYDLKYVPKRIRLKFFKKFPQGINYYLFSLLSVYKALKLKTDLYITRNLFTLILLNVLKKKVIIEIHHDLSNEGKLVKFLYKNFNILNSKNILKIVAITKSVKNFLTKDLKVKKNKIQIIPSASSLKIKFSKLYKRKKYNIGYFGSLEKSKGSDFIIKMSKLDINNKYFVYGGSEKTVKELRKKTLNHNIYLHSHISYKDLKKKIKKMDILLMPSNKTLVKSLGGVGNIAKYTSPLKLFDYLASGKLIYLSELKVFNEIIKNKKNCIVINRLNPYIWCNHIQKISKNLKKINILKKNAYNLSKNYTYEKRAQQILKNIY